MTLRTDDELDAALVALAELEGVSKQEAARRAILEKAVRTRRRSRITAVAEQVMVDYSEALDRLSRT